MIELLSNPDSNQKPKIRPQTYRIEIRFDFHGTLDEAEAHASKMAALVNPQAEVTAIFDEGFEEVG